MAHLPKPATIVEVHAILDNARERYMTAFEKLTSNAEQYGLEIRTEIVVGNPADQIIKRTEAGGIDMVLLGHRTTSSFAKLIVGSISEPLLLRGEAVSVDGLVSNPGVRWMAILLSASFRGESAFSTWLRAPVGESDLDLPRLYPLLILHHQLFPTYREVPDPEPPTGKDLISSIYLQ